MYAVYKHETTRGASACDMHADSVHNMAGDCLIIRYTPLKAPITKLTERKRAFNFNAFCYISSGNASKGYR